MYAVPFAFAPSTSSLLIILFVGMLLFGKNLPEMGRMLAKGIREFQNGLKGIEDDVMGASLREPQPARLPRLPPRITSTPRTLDNHDGAAPSV